MKIKFEEFLNEQNEWDPFGEEVNDNYEDQTLNILQKLDLSFIFDHELNLYPNGWPPVKVILYIEGNYVELAFDNQLDRHNFLKELYNTKFGIRLKSVRSNLTKHGRFDHIVKYEKI